MKEPTRSSILFSASNISSLKYAVIITTFIDGRTCLELFGALAEGKRVLASWRCGLQATGDLIGDLSCREGPINDYRLN